MLARINFLHQCVRAACSRNRPGRWIFAGCGNSRACQSAALPAVVSIRARGRAHNETSTRWGVCSWCYFTATIHPVVIWRRRRVDRKLASRRGVELHVICVWPKLAAPLADCQMSGLCLRRQFLGHTQRRCCTAENDRKVSISAAGTSRSIGQRGLKTAFNTNSS